MSKYIIEILAIVLVIGLAISFTLLARLWPHQLRNDINKLEQRITNIEGEINE